MLFFFFECLLRTEDCARLKNVDPIWPWISWSPKALLPAPAVHQPVVFARGAEVPSSSSPRAFPFPQTGTHICRAASWRAKHPAKFCSLPKGATAVVPSRPSPGINVLCLLLNFNFRDYLFILCSTERYRKVQDVWGCFFPSRQKKTLASLLLVSVISLSLKVSDCSCVWHISHRVLSQCTVPLESGSCLSSKATCSRKEGSWTWEGGGWFKGLMWGLSEKCVFW